jgi:hypothetical protein
MDIDRLQWHLENWTEWMSRDTVKLGYPAKSLMVIGGGAVGADDFEILCDSADSHAASMIDAIIDSISLPQRTAINHQWLKVTHHYQTQDLDILEAYDAIIKIADRRGLL